MLPSQALVCPFSLLCYASLLTPLSSPPLPHCSTFTVTYRYPLGGRVTGASLAAPCADTHSINMNQRVVFLEVRSLVVRHRPATDIAHQGMHVINIVCG